MTRKIIEREICECCGQVIFSTTVQKWKVQLSRKQFYETIVESVSMESAKELAKDEAEIEFKKKDIISESWDSYYISNSPTFDET